MFTFFARVEIFRGFFLRELSALRKSEASQYEERLTERGNFLRQKLFNFLRGSGPSANEAHGGAL